MIAGARPTEMAIRFTNFDGVVEADHAPAGVNPLHLAACDLIAEQNCIPARVVAVGVRLDDQLIGAG